MKAIICKKFAPVSDLVWEEVADPVAGPGEVVVDIKAAGLNYPDNLIVHFFYGDDPSGGQFYSGNLRKSYFLGGCGLMARSEWNKKNGISNSTSYGENISGSETSV